jgi:hypothetical protein
VDAETLLTTSRSVRRKLDLDRPVEPEVIIDCLRIAMQAPAAEVVLHDNQFRPGVRPAVEDTTFYERWGRTG